MTGAENSTVHLVGVDCATDPSRMGLARGVYTSGRTKVTKVKLGSRVRSVAAELRPWIDDLERTLLAIDAPLGWPRPLGAFLADHCAGDPTTKNANVLFRRETDRVVRRALAKQPLDVGADRIARTAVAALTLLGSLGEKANLRIQLAWEGSFTGPVAAIEVYPAGTIVAHGFHERGYRAKGGERLRSKILHGVRRVIDVNSGADAIVSESADALDAVLCVLAAHDFLCGDVIRPENEHLARKEGWIWIKCPLQIRGA
jgi:predicted RNase H-like nuclease